MSRNQPASLGAAAARPIREPVQLNWQRMNTIGGVLIIVGILGFIAGHGRLRKSDAPPARSLAESPCFLLAQLRTKVFK